MTDDDENNQSARMEQAITEMVQAVQRQSEVTFQGCELLVSMRRVFEPIMTVLETQMDEVIVELRSQARHLDDLITKIRSHGDEAA